MQITRNGQVVDVGNAVFSKHPILTNKIHNLSKANNRVAIEVSIQVGNKTLHVFNTHLLHTHQEPSQVQEIQANNLINVLPVDNTVLMGDFNALPESKTIKAISAVLKNSDNDLLPTWSVYPEGCKGCLPRGVIYKLDNILISKDVKTHSYQVAHSKASDHLPISVVIEI